MSGDSLEVFLPGRTLVALSGIKAPAGNTQCGELARAQLARLVTGGVDLEGVAGNEFDATGRRLFRAFTAGGEDIALLLLQEGLATTQEGGEQKAAYVQAEKGARAASVGCVWD